MKGLILETLAPYDDAQKFVNIRNGPNLPMNDKFIMY